MKLFLSLCLVFVLLLVGCGGEEPNVEATVIAAIAATEAAAPTVTATPVPTDTATPTSTPTPVPTNTPTATATTVPTDTPTPIPTDTPTPASTFETTTLDNGWVRYKSAQDAFMVALPPDWIYLDLTSEDLESLLGTAGDANPAMGELLSSQNFQQMVATGIKFYAMDLSTESISSGFPTNMNVLIQDVPLALPLEDFVSLSAVQVSALFNTDEPAVSEVVTIGEREVGKITYQVDLNTAVGGQIPAGFTQYVIIEGDLVYVLTFTSLASQQETLQPVFEEIMASVEIGE